MRRLAVVLLLFAPPLLAFAETPAPEPIPLKIKLGKGLTWKVEQTLEMTGVAGDATGNPGKNAPFVKGAWVLKEAWADTVEVEAEGRPLSVRRVISASKAGESGRPAEATTAEGVTLLVEEDPKEPRSVVSASKGAIPQPITDVLSKGPVDPVSWLLPAGAVKVGDTWKISAQVVCQFGRINAASMEGAPHTTSFLAMLQDLRATEPTVNGCEVTAKVASVDKNEAVVEYEGEAGTPLAKTVISGKLRWNVVKSRPIQLDWTRKRTVKANEETNTKGWNEDWKLAKSWK